MMRPSIEAIIFDVGGTLRATQPYGGCDLSGVQNIQVSIGDTTDPHQFQQKIHSREVEYRKWVLKSLVEASEADLWSKYLLPDFPTHMIQENAVKLNRLWRESKDKFLLPDAVTTLRTLSERGYVLGIISNTTSSTEVPKMLRENDIDRLFSNVLLSTTYGRRKPHPSIFLAAAERLGVSPNRCTYVGDQLSRDLIGARQAGFAEVVIIDINGYHLDVAFPDEDSSRNNHITAMKPDHRIEKLSELLPLYPKRKRSQPLHLDSPQYYDAALSTMWGIDQDMPFSQTFEIGRKSGFPRFELNHAVTPELFEQWDRNRYYINTVHDPCPAVYLNEEIKTRDFTISSLNEKCRIKGIDLAKRTIDLACALGSRSVVLHPGMIVGDHRLEHELRKLFQSGRQSSQEYREVTRELIKHRELLAAPHFDKVMNSMTELIQYCRPTGIELALENRYHYYDIPILDEMQRLLDLCDEPWYGYQYDSGHAHTLDVLGLCSHEEWLTRFGKRMIGAHLHDSIGIKDHQVPGKGEIDFSMIAPYIPSTAYRTLELAPSVAVEDLRKALEVLNNYRCIEKVDSFEGVQIPC